MEGMCEAQTAREIVQGDPLEKDMGMAVHVLPGIALIIRRTKHDEIIVTMIAVEDGEEVEGHTWDLLQIPAKDVWEQVEQCKNQTNKTLTTAG